MEEQDLATSSSDESYKALRNEILAGALKPGDALKERELCARLGNSRTPIREALRRLVADGLAELRPRRSIVVSSYSDEELGEIFELGSLLETHVAGLAAQKADREDVAALEDILGDMEQVLATEDKALAAEFARLDQAFHDRIASAARNRRIASILRQTVSLRLLANLMARYRKSDFKASVAQHREIVAQIARGDAEAARAAMQGHVSAKKPSTIGD